MVTGSKPKSGNQGKEKISEKSSSKAKDEMPSVCTSTNETTSGDVSCYMCMAVHCIYKCFVDGLVMYICHFCIRLTGFVDFKNTADGRSVVNFVPKSVVPIIKFRLWVLLEVLIIDLWLALVSLG